MTYGLWKHGRAGGWCEIKLGHRCGSRGEVEAAQVVLSRENPELEYTVEEFDADREPEAHIEHVTHAMLDCLEAVLRGQDPYLPRALGGRFSRGTVRRLFDQGLIVEDPWKMHSYRVTKAGRAELGKRRA